MSYRMRCPRPFKRYAPGKTSSLDLCFYNKYYCQTTLFNDDSVTTICHKVVSPIARQLNLLRYRTPEKAQENLMQKTEPHRYEKIIRPRRLPDEIAAKLTGQISDGILQPGDKLPTEQELATNYGVARTVVREAVSQLKSDGMIQSKQGVGAFVSEPGARSVFRISADCFAKRKELVQILQLRTSNEAGAAALAAEARSDADLALIYEQLQSMQVATGQTRFETAEHRYDAERRFYRAIARACGNSYFYDFLTMLDGRIDANLRNVAIKNVMTAEWGDGVIGEHKMVYEAIRAQNKAAAEIAVRQHFENAAGRLMERADIADVTTP